MRLVISYSYVSGSTGHTTAGACTEWGALVSGMLVALRSGAQGGLLLPLRCFHTRGCICTGNDGRDDHPNTQYEAQ